MTKRMAMMTTVAAIAALVPLIGAQAVAATGCRFDTTSPGVAKLLASCETEETILVRHGETFDGGGHTIRAVGASFDLAVVTNVGDVTVTNVTIDGSGITGGCDDALWGILISGGSASVTNSRVTGLDRPAADPCGEGVGIEVRLLGPDRLVTAEIAGNTVDGYGRTGIAVTGNVAATVTGNTVTGAGAAAPRVQRGIRVSAAHALGSARPTGTISDNLVLGNDFQGCPTSVAVQTHSCTPGVAAGVELDGVDLRSVRVAGNRYRHNQTNVRIVDARAS